MKNTNILAFADRPTERGIFSTLKQSLLLCSIACLLILISSQPATAQTAQIQDLANNESIKNTIEKYDKFTFETAYDDKDQMRKFLSALKDIIEITTLLGITSENVYLNVAPDIPEGREIDFFHFSGMDPGKIPDKEIRAAYERKIAVNQKNHIISNQLTEIYRKLVVGIQSTVLNLPDSHKVEADQLLRSILKLRR